MFDNTRGCHIAPQRGINKIPMANALINQGTGVSLKYRQLIQDKDMFPIWEKSAANELGCLAQGVGALRDPTHFSSSCAKQSQKARFHLWLLCCGHPSKQT
jgi:hypothetical protein